MGFWVCKASVKRNEFSMFCVWLSMLLVVTALVVLTLRDLVTKIHDTMKPKNRVNSVFELIFFLNIKYVFHELSEIGFVPFIRKNAAFGELNFDHGSTVCCVYTHVPVNFLSLIRHQRVCSMYFIDSESAINSLIT